MNKKYLLVATAGICALTLLLAIFYDSSGRNNYPPNQNQYVASFDTLKINVEDFVFYKANAQLMAEMKNTQVPSDEDLINNMLKDKLTAYEAEQQGFTVSDEEVQEEIDFQRDAYQNQMEMSSPEAQDVYNMMKKRIEVTGLSEEEFWNSDFVKQGYKEVLLEWQLFNSLSGEDRVFKNVEDFQKYKDELWVKYKDNIILNLDLLNNI